MKNTRFVSIKTVLLLTATLLLGGCAGGSLTTREKGAGIGRWVAPLSVALSERRSAIRPQVQPSAVGLAWAPAPWSAINSRGRRTKTPGKTARFATTRQKSTGSATS